MFINLDKVNLPKGQKKSTYTQFIYKYIYVVVCMRMYLHVFVSGFLQCYTCAHITNISQKMEVQ
jgi:hypothetical protein